MKCIYCREAKPFTDEHVLTRAFAGQGENWTLVDTVCGECNAIFGACEREWTGAPGEAVARIYHGPAGRKRKGRSYRVHPATHVYMVREGDPIAYEAEVLDGLEPRLRPQIIWTGSELLALAADVENAPRLKAAFDLFQSQRELTIYKHPNILRSTRYLIAKLGALAGQIAPCVVGYEWRRKPAEAWLDSFPGNPSRTPFYCRMSVDQDDRLRIRAENLDTAMTFLQEISGKESLHSGLQIFPAGYTIHFEHSLDVGKMNQAIAKTAFNLAIKFLGREVMSRPAFDRCRAYCLTGQGDDPIHPFVGCIADDSNIARLPHLVRIRNEKCHILMLTSDGQRLVSLIRLYGGPVFRVHLGQTELTPFDQYAVVDYAGAGIRAL